MKWFVLIVTITAVWCYSVEKVKEINGEIVSLVSDAVDNTFVIAYNDSDNCTFYKLSSSNDVILSIDLPYPAYVLVNRFGDAYIFSTQNGVVTLWFLESFKTSVEQLSRYYHNSESGCANDANSFIDNDNIVYVNHGRGISYLRFKQNIIFGVDGLQDSKFCSHAEDVNGDVYLQLSSWDVAVITKEEKNCKIFHSKIVSDFMGEMDYVINGYQSRVFGVKYGAKYVSRIKMLQGSSKELLFLAYDVELRNPYSTKEHFVVFSYDRMGPTLLYILQQDAGVEVIKSDFFSTLCITGLSAANSDGHIFYSWQSSFKSGPPDQFGILRIKPIDMEAEKIIVPSNSTINSMLVDVDDNLWMIADGLYMLPKGANAVLRISDLPMGNSGKLKYLIDHKKLNKEILIGLEDGLYICKN